MTETANSTGGDRSRKLSEAVGRMPDMNLLRIDCGTCAVRGPACGDCMVTALLGVDDGVVELDSDEVSALKAMTEQGLLPPLRLVRPVSRPRPPESDEEWFVSGADVV